MWRKITFFSAIFCVVLCLPIMVSASVFGVDGENTSVTTLNLEGGYPQDYAFLSNGTALAATNSPNGFFIWDSANEEWDAPPSGSDFGNVNSIAVSDSDEVFFVGGISLYKYDGSTYSQVNGVTNVSQGIFYEDGVLYVPGRDGDLYASTDGGSTFSTLTIDTGVTGVVAMDSDTTTTLALVTTASDTDSSLYSTTDNGATWTSLSKTVTGVSAGSVQVLIKPTDSDYLILRGTDQTEKCNADTSVCSVIYAQSDGLAELEFAGDKLYMGKKLTQDDGANWDDVQGSGLEIRNDSIIAINPTDPTNILWKGMYGVIATEDEGTTTELWNTGLYGVTVNNMDQSPSKDVVCLSAVGGMALTTNYTDATPTWEYPLVPSSGSGDSYACWINPNDTDHIVADFGSIWSTYDGGSSWTEAGSTPVNTKDFLLDGTNLYATHDNGLSVSTDYGDNWTDLNMGAGPVNAIASDGSNMVLALGSESDSTSTNLGLYTYNGSAFTQVNDAGVNDKIFYDVTESEGEFFACSSDDMDGTVVKTTDAGATWTDLTANGLPSDGWFTAIAANPNNSDQVYVASMRPAGTSYIYKSIDGVNFSLYYTGLVSEAYNAMLYDGLIVGTTTGAYDMYSKVSLKMKRDKKKVKKGKKVKLTGTLKALANNNKLNNKSVKLYKKFKKSGTYKRVKTKKTGKKGKVSFKYKIKKKTYFVMRYKAKSGSAAAEQFSTDRYKSKRLVVKLKK